MALRHLRLDALVVCEHKIKFVVHLFNTAVLRLRVVRMLVQLLQFYSNFTQCCLM